MSHVCCNDSSEKLKDSEFRYEVFNNRRLSHMRYSDFYSKPYVNLSIELYEKKTHLIPNSFAITIRLKDSSKSELKLEYLMSQEFQVTTLSTDSSDKHARIRTVE